jgi:pimeloyl-ACP methyl ester carboxylesterase
MRRETVRKWLKRILRMGLSVYILLAIVFAALQTSMIFPGASSQGRKDAVVRPSPDEELLSLTTPSGERVAAIFGKALKPGFGRDFREDAARLSSPKSSDRPTIIYFYGNGMCMADCMGEFLRLRHDGFNVIVAEFLGYGMSSGKPSEAGCYATADAVYDYLLSRDDINRNKIVPVGWSLGAAAAIDLASRKPVAGVVTVSAFTSMHDMAHKLLPFMPTSLMLRHHFENERKLRSLDLPIFIAHGRDDDIIPYEMSDRLANAAKGPVTHMTIEGARHNDVFEIGGEKLERAIADFIERVAPEK